MPANLPPDYYEAERKYWGAKTIPEKVASLQEMMSATPKHKGTDHLRADQRARMARLMEELEKPSRTAGGRPEPFAIRKEGAGQATLVGLPNAGKSQLLASLTGAPARVDVYPFTTQVPLPGMVQFQNVQIQLVGTPAINNRDMQTRLFSLLRNTDILLIVIDLSGDVLEQMEEVSLELEKWGYLLLSKGEGPDPDEHRAQKRAVLVGTKADREGALELLLRLEARYGERYPVVMVSPLEEGGLDDLKATIFDALGMVRVYTKPESTEGRPWGQPLKKPAGAPLNLG